MEDITVNLYPDMRHEILNEVGKLSVFDDIIGWISAKI
jgi:alpha-beta hydrolase superfamily lysophospholipase